MATANCDKALLVSLASLQRNIMLTVFGMSSTDRTHMAEISIESSLFEIIQAEQETRQHLQTLVEVVRKRTATKSCIQLKSDLVKSSNLRKQLCTLQQKRIGMEMQMDKLRESKLNMQMLQSMKHTNIALQNIGLKVSDADDIMLDLAEAQSDAQDVQNSLASSFTHDEDISHLDLEAELQLMLSDDALLPMAPRHKAPISIQAAPAHDDELRMPTVAEATSKPPDEPPGATEAEAGSAVLEVVYTDAVTPISTMHPTKSAKTMHKTKARRQQQVSTAEPDEHTAPEASPAM
jgi:hypothetical protein